MVERFVIGLKPSPAKHAERIIENSLNNPAVQKNKPNGAHPKACRVQTATYDRNYSFFIIHFSF